MYMYNCHNLLFDYLKRVDFINPFQSFRLCCSRLNWKKYLLNKRKEIKQRDTFTRISRYTYNPESRMFRLYSDNVHRCNVFPSQSYRTLLKTID